MINYLMLLVSLFALSGCATIFSGSGPQTISIMTEPANADISIVNNRSGDVISKVKSPFTAVLERSDGEFKSATYKILLTLPGYINEEREIKSNLTGWFLGNILFGGVVGILIDGGTGAMFTLDNTPVKVKLYPDSLAGRMARDGTTYTTDDDNEAMEQLRQFGRLNKEKQVLLNDLQQKCPGFTPTSELPEHAECMKQLKAFVSALEKS